MDVAGNIGEDNYAPLTQHAKASVYTYEPTPGYFAQLKERFGHNPRANISNVGAADKSGEAELSLKAITVGAHQAWTRQSRENTSKYSWKMAGRVPLNFCNDWYRDNFATIGTGSTFATIGSGTSDICDCWCCYSLSVNATLSQVRTSPTGQIRA